MATPVASTGIRRQRSAARIPNVAYGGVRGPSEPRERDLSSGRRAKRFGSLAPTPSLTFPSSTLGAALPSSATRRGRGVPGQIAPFPAHGQLGADAVISASSSPSFRRRKSLGGATVEPLPAINMPRSPGGKGRGKETDTKSRLVQPPKPEKNNLSRSSSKLRSASQIPGTGLRGREGGNGKRLEVSDLGGPSPQLPLPASRDLLGTSLRFSASVMGSGSLQPPLEPRGMDSGDVIRGSFIGGGLVEEDVELVDDVDVAPLLPRLKISPLLIFWVVLFGLLPPRRPSTKSNLFTGFTLADFSVYDEQGRPCTASQERARSARSRRGSLTNTTGDPKGGEEKKKGKGVSWLQVTRTSLRNLHAMLVLAVLILSEYYLAFSGLYHVTIHPSISSALQGVEFVDLGDQTGSLILFVVAVLHTVSLYLAMAAFLRRGFLTAFVSALIRDTHSVLEKFHTSTWWLALVMSGGCVSSLIYFFSYKLDAPCPELLCGREYGDIIHPQRLFPLIVGIFYPPFILLIFVGYGLLMLQLYHYIFAFVQDVYGNRVEASAAVRRHIHVCSSVEVSSRVMKYILVPAVMMIISEIVIVVANAVDSSSVRSQSSVESSNHFVFGVGLLLYLLLPPALVTSQSRSIRVAANMLCGSAFVEATRHVTSTQETRAARLLLRSKSTQNPFQAPHLTPSYGLLEATSDSEVVEDLDTIFEHQIHPFLSYLESADASWKMMGFSISLGFWCFTSFSLLGLSVVFVRWVWAGSIQLSTFQS